MRIFLQVLFSHPEAIESVILKKSLSARNKNTTHKRYKLLTPPILNLRAQIYQDTKKKTTEKLIVVTSKIIM